MPPTAPLDLCFSMKAISLSDELSVWKSSIGPKALGFIEKPASRRNAATVSGEISSQQYRTDERCDKGQNRERVGGANNYWPVGLSLVTSEG
jgi:hypothetical protein